MTRPSGCNQAAKPRRAAPPVPLARRPSGFWELQLLGGCRARSGEVELLHWPTRHLVCLLARLALEPGRDHSRAELAELLWPSDTPGAPLDPAVQRNRLRQTLSTLKSLLEPAGHRMGPVLTADRRTVRLNAPLVSTDVQRFVALCEAARHDPASRPAAIALYRGELLPGYDEEWICQRREWLAGLHEELQQAASRSDTGTPDAPARRATRVAQSAWMGTAAGRITPAVGPRRVPAYVTPFFGRDDELLALAHLLAEHRVVQLLGPGGCGKTRLSVQWALHDRTFEAIVFVPLQDCPSPDRAVDHLRSALDLPATRVPPLEQVVDRLQGQRALVVFDTVEHLLGGMAPATGTGHRRRARPAPEAPGAFAAAPTPPPEGTLAALVRSLLDRLPTARVLLTSRRALAVSGARLEVRPLPLPPADATAAAAWATPSVALFVDRARAVRADFSLHAHNVRAVVRLCRLLDGLPVLIEIAASRLRHFRLHAMCEQLQAGLAAPQATNPANPERTSSAVLARTGPAASRAGHHRSVHALLLWSWRQLTPGLQAMLAAVVVFRGGWTLPAAAAVADCELTQAADALQELAEHHLVFSETSPGGAVRWHLLGVLREQVQAWVPAARAATHRRRLREHLLGWAQSLEARHEPLDESEAGNIDVALSSAIDDGDGLDGIALAVALQWAWMATGVHPRTVDHVDRLTAALPGVDPGQTPSAGEPLETHALGPALTVAFHALRARLLLLVGRGADAQRAGEQAMRCAEAAPGERHDALLAVTNVRWRLAPDPIALLPAARECWRAALDGGSSHSQARAAMLLGAMIWTRGDDVAAAQALFEQARDLFAATNDAAGGLSALPGLISCSIARGELRQAITLAEQARTQAARLRQVETELLLLNRLSTCHEQLRRWRQMARVNQQQLRVARAHGLAYHQAFALWNLSLALVRLRQAQTAVLLMAFTHSWWARSFGELQGDDIAQVDDLRERAERLLGKAPCQALWQQGTALQPDEAFGLAEAA